MYSGRPGTMSLDDFHDRLEAAFAKAKSKDKKLEAHEFLQQLPAYLENEALQVWRKKKWEILEPPEVEEGATKERKAKVLAEWDPIGDLVTLFKKEFGAASAAHVRELQNLTMRRDETCRMLLSRLERLQEETGILTEKEQALTFVNALPEKLRVQVQPVLWGNSPGGVYTLAQAFETAERIDLAQAYAEGHRGWQASELVGAPVLAPVAASIRGTVAGVARGSDGAGCFRCGEPDHVAARCTLSRTTKCGKCGKQGHAEGACWSSNPSMKPEWAGKKAAQGSEEIDPRDITIVELREEIFDLKAMVKELRDARLVEARRASPAGAVAVHANAAQILAERWRVVNEEGEEEE